MSELQTQDQWEIRQTLALYGHVVDAGAWHELDRVFALGAELTHDGRSYAGPAGVAEFECSVRGERVHAHHTLNTVIRGSAEPDRAHAWSRFVLVTADARALGGDLLDTLGRIDGEWRILSRRVTERDRDEGRAPEAYDPGEGEGFRTWSELP